MRLTRQVRLLRGELGRDSGQFTGACAETGRPPLPFYPAVASLTITDRTWDQRRDERACACPSAAVVRPGVQAMMRGCDLFRAHFPVLRRRRRRRRGKSKLGQVQRRRREGTGGCKKNHLTVSPK